jgi:GMP synthase-like glutamine amidotransferase
MSCIDLAAFQPAVPIVSVLHHLERPFLGHAAVPLREAGLIVDERFLRRGDPLPTVDETDGLLVLGGIESAVRADEDPLLRAESGLLVDAVTAGRPVLGICLGGQLLAHALGGRVRHVGRVVGWRALRKLPAAAADPLFGALPEPVPALHFNEDVFDAPPGADVLLGPAPSGTAAFRFGARAWGLQYHPDVDATVLESWIEDWAEHIPDVDALRASSAEWLDAQARASSILFGAFARIVADRA